MFAGLPNLAKGSIITAQGWDFQLRISPGGNGLTQNLLSIIKDNVTTRWRGIKGEKLLLTAFKKLNGF